MISQIAAFSSVFGHLDVRLWLPLCGVRAGFCASPSFRSLKPIVVEFNHSRSTRSRRKLFCLFRTSEDVINLGPAGSVGIDLV